MKKKLCSPHASQSASAGYGGLGLRRGPGKGISLVGRKRESGKARELTEEVAIRKASKQFRENFYVHGRELFQRLTQKGGTGGVNWESPNRLTVRSFRAPFQGKTREKRV